LGLQGAGDAAPVKRILLLGDSWAASIATASVTFLGYGTVDNVLADNGFGQYVSEGSQTAWGGTTASQWASSQGLATITNVLQTYPTIDIVHLSLGGNDFDTRATQGRNIMSYTPAQRAAFWNTIEADVQTVVNRCLSVRPDIRVLICDYDYLDWARIGSNYGGATTRQLNDAFMEVGQRKLAIAQRTSRCYYVDNWGLLQYKSNYPTSGLSAPGRAPNYTPYAGGNPDYPMPPVLDADGMHPTEQGFRYLVENCFEQYYRSWLSSSSVKAAFSAVPTAGPAPLTVSFTDESIADGDPIAHWEWQFGDGDTSYDQDPSHTYTSEGAYTVSLTVTTAGGTDTETQQWYIDVGNALPAVGWPGQGALLAVLALVGARGVWKRYEALNGTGR
jgi:hypothetical protein